MDDASATTKPNETEKKCSNYCLVQLGPMPANNIALTLVIMVVIGYAVVANLLVIYTLIRNRRALLSTEIHNYILVLAVTDLACSVIYAGGKLGLLLCVLCWNRGMQIWTAWYRTEGYSSTSLLVVMAAERFLLMQTQFWSTTAMTRPSAALGHRPKRPWLKPTVICALAWSLNAVVAFCYDLEQQDTLWQQAGLYIFEAVYTGLGTIVLLISSISIFCTIRAIQPISWTRNGGPSTAAQGHTSSSGFQCVSRTVWLHYRERRLTANLLLCLTVTWVLSQLPGNILYIWSTIARYNPSVSFDHRKAILNLAIVASLVPLALNPTSVFVLSSTIRRAVRAKRIWELK